MEPEHCLKECKQSERKSSFEQREEEFSLFSRKLKRVAVISLLKKIQRSKTIYFRMKKVLRKRSRAKIDSLFSPGHSLLPAVSNEQSEPEHANANIICYETI
ncbi:Cell cycle protein GpsB [Trichinella spiralis]|uniref:Cell cycle protein GpsB n=1 Tax=Trichinella spiralis TaxID=6334 RepID=A0ABR3KL53_TRISP